MESCDGSRPRVVCFAGQDPCIIWGVLSPDYCFETLLAVQRALGALSLLAMRLFDKSLTAGHLLQCGSVAANLYLCCSRRSGSF